MRLADIKADGTVYFFDTRQDWGTYLGQSYDRGAVRRVDDKRYRNDGYSYGPFRPREDAAGKYIKVERVAKWKTDAESGLIKDADDDRRFSYVLPGQIRATWENAEARYNKTRAAEDTERDRKDAENQAMRDRVADLTARAKAAGLPVTVEGLPADYHRHRAVVTVTMGSADLAALLDRLDAVEVGRAGAFAAGIDRGDQYGEISAEDRRQAYEDYITRLVTSTMSAVQAADTIAAVNRAN